METPISEIPDSDWELVVLPNSDQTHHSSSGGGGDGDVGVIQPDYFSLELDLNNTATSPEDADGEESDNPRWVDPIDISTVGGNKGISSCSSHPSSSDSGDHDLLDLIRPNSDCSGGHGGDSDSDTKSMETVEKDGGNGFKMNHVEACEIVENDSGRNDVEVNSGIESCGKDGVDDQFEGNEGEDENENEERVVWWKFPIEVLKCWVMRVRPIWSLSMVAAALVGFVVLRHRFLEKVKRKSLGIRRNVIVDDKMVSQIMNQVARLNKALSVVKRVPIIRPALPAPGMGPWPVMNLR